MVDNHSHEEVDSTSDGLLLCTGSRVPEPTSILSRNRALDSVLKEKENRSCDRRRSFLRAPFSTASFHLLPFHMPSSMPTCLHQGVSVVALTILSASPTWRLALTSRPFLISPPALPALLFNFIAMLESVKLGISLCCLPTRVNPWDEREVAIPELPAKPLPRLCVDPFIHSSLMTGRCHCSGSELDDRRFKCK